MRRLTSLIAIVLGVLAVYGAHATQQRGSAARAQDNQTRVVLFEKFSRKS
jgi:hypothetical protein